MKLYCAVVAYDGTNYCGWQQQPDCPTVANTLEDVFFRVFGQHITLTGASRTDAGVHALGQTVRFGTTLFLDPRTMHRAWNAALPHDIYIRSLDYAPLGFHPQHDIIEKVYCYHIFTKKPLPHMVRFGYWHHFPIDEKKFEEALDLFVGTHDFWSFCTEEDQERDFSCRISAIKVTYLRRYHMIRVTVHGKRFLYRMVRRMIGSALAIASSKYQQPELIAKALLERMPREYFKTAPPEGLLLRKIRYDKDAMKKYVGLEKGDFQKGVEQ